MVAGVLGQEIIAKVMLGRGGVAVPSLELANDELGKIGPVRRRRRFRADVITQVVVMEAGVGRIQVAGGRVVQSRNVGRAFNRVLAPTSQASTTHPADVPP